MNRLVILFTAIISVNNPHLLIKRRWRDRNSKFLSILPTLNLTGNLGGRLRRNHWERMATVGGITPVEGIANSVEIESLAKFAVEEYNKKENAMLDFVKVVDAKQQVVAGTIYYITLVAKDGAQEKLYEAKVWVKPWMNFKEVQGFKYVGNVGNATTVGGITPVDGTANSVEIQNLAKFAVEEYNKKENAMLDFIKVVDAKQQVVAGNVYYITLVAKDGDQEKVYEAKVWVKPWMNFKEVQEFKFLGDVPAAADGGSS